MTDEPDKLPTPEASQQEPTAPPADETSPLAGETDPNASEAALPELPREHVPELSPAGEPPTIPTIPATPGVSGDDDRPPRRGVDPEDIRKALEEQAKRRPPRPPVNELLPPIPKLKVNKPRFRKHKP